MPAALVITVELKIEFRRYAAEYTVRTGKNRYGGGKRENGANENRGKLPEHYDLLLKKYRSLQNLNYNI
jgi:hypothetical protein